MTALAGFWAFDDRRPVEPCSRILDGQSLFGKQRALDEHKGLALGRLLYPTLPEDDFDRSVPAVGEFRMVADVRLDNRSELAAALGLSSADATSRSDSAILFDCLLKWGAEAIDRLVGEFAFAFWDAARRELLLARDFLGARPLCYHRAKGFFAFASMPSGLHALPEVPRNFNPDFLAVRLAMLPHHGPSTAYRDIERVEPGQFLRVSADQATATRFWTPPAPASSPAPNNFAEGLRTLFDQAVDAQLRGSREAVATQLSGGLDSSTVTATAARLLVDGKVVAFTAVPRRGFRGATPPGTIADESALAAETARLYPNIEHVIIENNGESPLRWMDEHFLYQQGPMSSIANAWWGHAIHQAATSRGLKVILKGSVGNLSISYSGLEWLAQLLASGHLLTLARESVSLVRHGLPLKSVAARALGPFVPRLWRLARSFQGKATGVESHSAINRAWLASARENRASNDRLNERPLADPVTGRVAALFHSDPGWAVKSALAQWGLSVRDPTGDKRVVEYCLAVPPAEFVRGGIPRSLARRAFADRLPSEVAQSRIRGYQSADWHENLNAARHDIEQEVAQILRCDGVDEVLDVAWLEDSLQAWPETGWDEDATARRYRLGLLRGISAGHFMRKVRGTN